MEIDWNEVFEYDESVDTKLLWKGGYRNNGKKAGRLYKGKYGQVTYKRKPYSIKDIVWEMHHGKVGGGEVIMYKDGDTSNLSINNLYKAKDIKHKHKYDRYLGEYLRYDEESPSKLTWVKPWRFGSKVKSGDYAGSLDKGDNHWRVNALGTGGLKASKVVWALFNDFQDQTGKEIDHINGDPTDNRIENLRLVSRDKNARNRSLSKASKTGINGVTYSERMGSKGQTLGSYCATVYINGVKRNRSFSCNKWGEELALLAASEWRDKIIYLLNQQGAGYTLRHGTNNRGGDIKLQIL